MRAWTLGVSAAAAAVAAVLGCGAGGGYGSSSPAPVQCSAATATPLGNGTVTLAGMSFSPACAKVTAPATITFANDDTLAHTVTSDVPGVFDHFVNSHQQVTQAFTTPGTVGIHCTIHAGMRMTLIVQ